MSDEGGNEQDPQQQGTPNGEQAPQPQGETEGKPDTGAPERKAGESETDWKARSRQHEDRAKANKRAADEALAERDKLAGTLDALRKALDPEGAGKDDDPATIAEKAIAERDAVKAEARLARVELAAERAARKAGADVDALLDSRSFLDRLGKLDPAADGFADEVGDAVKAALKDNPRLKADTGRSASPTADMTGGGGEGGGAQTIDERREARRKRRAG